MNGINKVILVGNLGKDAETQVLPSGVSVTRFSLATKRSRKDESGNWKSETDWHRVVAWNREKLAPYLVKGVKVALEGGLRTHSYENKDGVRVYVTEVFAETIELCGMYRADGSDGPPPSKASKPATGEVVTDDDVPF